MQNLRNILVLIALMQMSLGALAQQDTTKYNILLTGASFASSHNSWFEIACEHLGANAINRAIGGEAIVNTANRMEDGTLYSFEEFENLDAFVIMQVHERDVIEGSMLKDDYKDYEMPMNRDSYARAFDYVIKRYIKECYDLKDNPKSKYYGTETGKPAVIVLCTHWHDGRVVYNSTVRELAEKWGLPLVEFDKNIGFSRKTTHPATGKQTSLLYAKDTQKLYGVEYGWHPKRGRGEYIQQRLAAIFADRMKSILPIK